MTKVLGRTVQLYTTGRCGMNCSYCNSRRQRMPDMTLRTFRQVVECVRANGVQKIELFANDPLLHPGITKQIEMLNESGLDYAILTVGASPNDRDIKTRFFRLIDIIERKRSAFVFSVDFGEERSKEILNEGRDDLFAYAFKAKTFWDLAPLLQTARVAVRSNTVISRHNVGEVVTIMRQVVEMGFAASFCFVQFRQPEFDRLSREGLTLELEGEFREYLRDSKLLGDGEIERVITQARHIVARGELRDLTIFNTFRGDDASEGDIPEAGLKQLRQEILALKSEFPGKVLPADDFIRGLGSRGFGCSGLLQQKRFPQMKIGSEGQMIFCCDLHDPPTQQYHISEMHDEGVRDSFLEMIRTNPYILICTSSNPCDFSVNRIVYDA